eukprot:scaffold2184_cov128-Cylindrotheca_fusiformis.AAC.13
MTWEADEARDKTSGPRARRKVQELEAHGWVRVIEVYFTRTSVECHDSTADRAPKHSNDL